MVLNGLRDGKRQRGGLHAGARGQASIVDALFFLTVVVVLSAMLQFFAIGYGDLTREQIARQYTSIYATAAMQTLLFSSAPREARDVSNNPVDLESAREVDYLLAGVKEDFSDDCALTARSKLVVLDTLKDIMSGLGTGFDYIFYFYVPDLGPVNKAVEECPDPEDPSRLLRDNPAGLREKNILAILKATPQIVGPPRFPQDPSRPMASACPSGEGVCVKAIDGTLVTADDPASAGEAYLYFLCSPRRVSVIEYGLLLERVGGITAPQGARINLHRVRYRQGEPVRSMRLQAIANLAVWPAVSVLRGTDEEGNPVSDDFFTSPDKLNCCSAGALREAIADLEQAGVPPSEMDALLQNDPRFATCLR